MYVSLEIVHASNCLHLAMICFYFVICQVVSINVILEFYSYSNFWVEFLAIRKERFDLFSNVIAFCYIVFVSDGKIC